MKRFGKIYFFISLFFLLFNVYARDLSFKLEQTFEHDIVFSRIFSDAVVDQDGDLIVSFGVPGCVIVTPEKLELVAKFGKGPGDLSGAFALNILDHQALVIEGYIGKTHVFKKQNGIYKWQRNEVRELKKSFAPSDTLFLKKKWFVAAFNTDYDKKSNRFSVNYLQVYSDKGKFIKSLIQESYEEPWSINLFYCFLVQYKNQVFFLSEDRFLLRIITGDDPQVTKTVKLEYPKFYKKMPKTFYHFPKRQMDRPQNYWKNMAVWKTGYSRICNVLVDGRWLIVQARTADEDSKLFGLLFYDADTFELKHTIMTNDLLLANKDGKLYFLRGGNPTWDDVEDTVFDIYKIVEKK